MNMRELNQAIKAYGGNRSALARAIGASPDLVSKWLKAGKVPPWRDHQVREAVAKLQGEKP